MYLFLLTKYILIEDCITFPVIFTSLTSMPFLGIKLFGSEILGNTQVNLTYQKHLEAIHRQALVETFFLFFELWPS